MKTNKNVLIMAAVCIALAGCAKKNVKDNDMGNTMPSQAPTTTTNPVAPEMTVRYTPADLDTDSCLRQREIYFDLDQDTLK